MTKVETSQKKISSFLNSDRKTIKGLEKENLRSDPDGKISNNDFPKTFGIHNFNSFVTLDYSEPHLEIVTPTLKTTKSYLGS
jgi:Gamma-glutamylcysteine synthetase